MGYVQDKILGYRQMAKPIYAAIRGGILNWGSEAGEALQRMKRGILD